VLTRWQRSTTQIAAAVVVWLAVLIATCEVKKVTAIATRYSQRHASGSPVLRE
jgi:hypothetical protein